MYEYFEETDSLDTYSIVILQFKFIRFKKRRKNKIKAIRNAEVENNSTVLDLFQHTRFHPGRIGSVQ